MVGAHDIARARSFNRLVARHIGALNGSYMGHRQLGELRVLFEIGDHGATPRDIRTRLGLDSGYVSRVIASLRRDGLITSQTDPGDRRTNRLRATAAGRAEMRELDRLTDQLVASTLVALSEEQRERLLRAQDEVRRLLAVAMVSLEPEDPASPHARWCLDHYFAELGERFEEQFDPHSTLP